MYCKTKRVGEGGRVGGRELPRELVLYGADCIPTHGCIKTTGESGRDAATCT